MEQDNLDKNFEFRRVTLDKENRWSYVTMIIILSGIVLTSIGNLVLFGSTFTITSSSQIYIATLYVFRWLVLLLCILTIGMAVLLMTLPRKDYQFDWCYRPKDPQDIVDDYGTYQVLGSEPKYKDPPNASLNWKRLNPAPESTIAFPTLEKSIAELKQDIREKQNRWAEGNVDISDEVSYMPIIKYP